MTKHLIAITGPTAIGKTTIAIELAQFFKTEIISCDSRQFYKEIKIASAVPTKEELLQVPHHFIHSKSIHDDYSVGAYEKDVIQLLNQLFKKCEIVFLVGGSGLFMDAVLKGIDYFPEVDSKIREKLNKNFEEGGFANLQNQLKEVDFESYQTIDINNPKRVIRALEIYLGTHTKFSSFKNTSSKKRDFKILKIGLQADRPLLYERINKRVDEMIKNGLIEEAKELHPMRNLNALNTIGLNELFSHFEGALSLEEAVELIKRNSRRYAKRQLTWNRKNEMIQWFDYPFSGSKIRAFIEQTINESRLENFQ